MSYHSRREQFVPCTFRSGYVSVPRRDQEYFVMDMQDDCVICCESMRHARALRTIKNKSCRSWKRWVACHQDKNGFQILEG